MSLNNLLSPSVYTNLPFISTVNNAGDVVFKGFITCGTDPSYSGILEMSPAGILSERTSGFQVVATEPNQMTRGNFAPAYAVLPISGDITLDTLHAGTTYELSPAGATAITIPAALAELTGLTYTFIQSTTGLANPVTITTPGNVSNLVGHMIGNLAPGTPTTGGVSNLASGNTLHATNTRQAWDKIKVTYISSTTIYTEITTLGAPTSYTIS